MTVAEIKEYIDNAIQESEQVGMSGYDCALYLKNSMRIVRSMLDELEPNTISQAIKVIDKEKDKLKFDTDKHQVDSCIFEIRNILGLGAKENNNGNKNAH